MDQLKDLMGNDWKEAEWFEEPDLIIVSPDRISRIPTRTLRPCRFSMKKYLLTIIGTLSRDSIQCHGHVHRKIGCLSVHFHVAFV